MSQKTSLTDFDGKHPDGEEENTEHSSSNADSPIGERDASNYEVTDTALPSQGDWNNEIEIYHDVSAGVRLTDSFKVDITTKSTPATLSANQVAYIVDGVDDLKQASETVERVYPPSSYSDFADFESYFAQVTTTFSSSRYGGWGIPADRFETALRFVTGGGRYNAANITVTALEFKKGWVIEYQGNAFLFSYAKVGQPEETITTHEVNGITVENEDDPGVLTGIERAMEVLPKLGIQITGFQKRRNNSLYFETNQDDPIAFTGSQLKKFTSPTTDLREYEGTHTIDLFHQDESYEYTWESGATKHDVGDVISHEGSDSQKLVLGYTRSTTRIQSGLRPDKYTVGTRVLAKPWYLQVRPDAYDGRIDTRVYSSNSKEIIAEVPYDVPDHPDPDSLDTVKLWDPDAPLSHA